MHRISFEEASSVYRDENAFLIGGPDHPDEEGLFILLGYSFHLRILVVPRCYRETEPVIRSISVRKASERERVAYARRLGD